MVQNRRNWLMKIGLAIAGIGMAKFKLFALPLEKNNNRFTGAPPFHLNQQTKNMIPGAFSVSLNVKNINASKEFYEHIGFNVFAGDIKENYLIMKNGVAIIGLFQGVFEKTILTFNPGWDENAQPLEQFDDVREIQRQLKSKGIILMSETDETSTGPASMLLTDPDGNQLLFDQHV